MPSVGRIKTRVLDPAAFLAALAAPRHSLEFSTHGYSTIPKEWIVMTRAIQEHLIYMVDEHALEGRVANRRLRLEAGDFVWISPGVLHEFGIPRGAPPPRMYHMKMTIRPRGGRISLRLKRDCIYLKQSEALQQPLKELIEEARGDLPYADARRRAAAAMLATRMLRLAGARPADGPALDLRQRRLLAEYVEARAAQRPAPSDLAEVLRLNPDYFARLFKRTYGIAPREWLVRERLHVAARRLQSSALSIGEVAYALGYRDLYLFSRQFKQVFGRSPRAFRRET